MEVRALAFRRMGLGQREAEWEIAAKRVAKKEGPALGGFVDAARSTRAW